jgi:hypothetical protein
LLFSLITSEKGDVLADKENGDKIKRKIKFMLEQAEVFDKLDGGMSVAAVRHH